MDGPREGGYSVAGARFFSRYSSLQIRLGQAKNAITQFDRQAATVEVRDREQSRAGDLGAGKFADP